MLSNIPSVNIKDENWLIEIVKLVLSQNETCLHLFVIIENIQHKYVNTLRKAFRSSCLVRLYLQLFVGGLISYLRYLCLLAHSGVQHILCCVFCFVSLRLVYPMLLVSLDCPFLMSPSVFSNVYWQQMTLILKEGKSHLIRKK